MLLRAYPDELICDLAETYHILDYRKVPVPLLATLAWGLKPDSRCMSARAGLKVPISLVVQAMTCDAGRLSLWRHTQDFADGKPRPQSLAALLMGEESGAGFSNGEAFMAWREKMMGGVSK